MFHTHSNELAHWGVKGMKWGVRRYRNRDGSLTPAGRKRYENTWSDEAKEVSRLKRTKNVKEMSNSELKRYNERVRLEQEYSRLSPNKVKKGMAVVAAAVITMETMNKFYNNSNNLYTNTGKAVATGRHVVNKLLGK